MRTLVYGPGKSKKTWWGLMAAEANLNVILIDGDDGAHIINQIPKELLPRITVLNVVDKFNSAVFAKFMAHLLFSDAPFYWDEDVKAISYAPNKEHYNTLINRSKLDKNTLLIFDSWSSLAQSSSLAFAIENKIDLADAEKVDWDGYGYQGRFLSTVLNKLHAMPCHILVIGHETVYEKRSKDGKSVISQRTQPLSSSGPHGKQLAKEFSDVLRFYPIAKNNFQIQAFGTQDEDGGSRLVEPKLYPWNELQYRVLLEAANAVPPEYKKQEAFISFDPGEELIMLKDLKSASNRPTLNATNPRPAATVDAKKPSGLLALSAKK